MKICSRCKINKKITLFSKCKTVKDGLDGNCKECRRKYTIKHKGRQKEIDILRRYGITLQQLNKMYADQKGVCPVCFKKIVLDGEKAIVAHIDHNHATKLVRGLLCSHCNQMLGHAFESIETLQRAIDYLKKHSS